MWTGSNWYLAGQRFTRQSHTFSASEHKSGDDNRKMTPHKGDSGTEKKKKRKSGEAFTESEKKKLENRTSSDDSDGGPCWSDYERVPGTKAGEKGSRRLKAQEGLSKPSRTQAKCKEKWKTACM